MPNRRSSLALVLLVIACGGTTNNDGGSGASQGGSSHGGNGGSSHAGDGGSGANAGKASAGSPSIGGSVDNDGAGGSSAGAGESAGGTGTVDARCPARTPMGTCSAADVDVVCQYDNPGQCLCYRETTPGLGPCQQVDPKCPNGSGGSGGNSAAKILPSRQSCRCTAGTWSCTFGV